MNPVMIFSARFAGAIIGAWAAEKVIDGYMTRRDNGNFARAAVEGPDVETPDEPETEPAEFHRDPPEDSKVAYTVAKEPDATL